MQCTPSSPGQLDSNGTDFNTLITRVGTPADLGSGADLASNAEDIEGQTDDIGVAGVGLTAIQEGFIEQFACDSGTSTICVDAGLGEADNFWRGAALRAINGTNAGQQRCAVASDQSDTNVTVIPAFPASLGTSAVQLVRDINCIGVNPSYTP